MFSTAVDELQQRCASRTAPLAAAAASASALDSRARLEVWSAAGDSGGSRGNGVRLPPDPSTMGRLRPRPGSSSSLHEVVQSAAPALVALRQLPPAVQSTSSNGCVPMEGSSASSVGDHGLRKHLALESCLCASSPPQPPSHHGHALPPARLILLDLASISIDLARSRHNIPFALSISLVIQEAALARLGLAVGWRLA